MPHPFDILALDPADVVVAFLQFVYPKILYQSVIKNKINKINRNLIVRKNSTFFLSRKISFKIKFYFYYINYYSKFNR